MLPPDDITSRLIADGLVGWAFAGDALHARFTTGGFAAGLAFVQRVGEAAEELDHHPDLDLRYTFVDVHSTSHDVGGVTRRDLRLARRIAEIAADAGLTAAPTD